MAEHRTSASALAVTTQDVFYLTIAFFLSNVRDVRLSVQNEKDFRKMSKRRKSVGHVKVRRIYSGNELKEVSIYA